MLAHKVDVENPAGYSDLLLATHKLDRRTEAREPLPQKTTVASGSNATCSQAPGNLFPLHRLKGNCTFAAQAVAIGNDEGEADSSAKQEEGNKESLAHEEDEASYRAGGTDQHMEYVICFAKAVKLYQQKNRSCFGCRSPNHLMQDCPKVIRKSAWKVDLNTKEGRHTPQKPATIQQTSPEETPQA